MKYYAVRIYSDEYVFIINPFLKHNFLDTLKILED